MKDKTCLPQLPQLQSYVLGLVLAVSSLCTTIRSISDLFPRRCLEEKVLGKGKGFQWFLQRVAFALFPWSFMVFPSLSSCFLPVIVVLLVEAFWYHGLWSPLGTWRAWKPPLPVLTLSSNDWCPLCSLHWPIWRWNSSLNLNLNESHSNLHVWMFEAFGSLMVTVFDS